MADVSTPVKTTEPPADDASPGSPQTPQSPSLATMTAAAARRRRKEQEEKELEAIGQGGQENVSVCIRVRPFNRREMEIQNQSMLANEQFASIVRMPNGLGGYLQCMERDPQTGEHKLKQEFQYTKTFWSIPMEQEMTDPPQEPITQLDIFRIVGEPIIKYALAGFNNCVFAYGQTGSGKTHTMTGNFELTEDGEFAEQTGLIPRLCRKLFETIEEKRAFQEDGIVKTIDVQLNAIEIYNEQVRDLFWRSTPGRAKTSVLQVRMHPTEGAFVDQLTILHPKDWRDCIRKIDKGISERTTAATQMNDESSRSHSVFQIIVTQTETVHVRSDDPDERYSKPVTYKKVSKINLVDLAGSERAKKSGAAGQQLKEASNINQSLFTLKKVIDSLVINSKETNPKRHVAIPFRESTLTRLLSDSLGGNSKTTMIACVSPHYDNQEETLLTLQYANRTGAIVNNTRVNEDTAAKQALALKHHILELQRRLAEGPVDEAAEELLDEIEEGRRLLKEMEEKHAATEREFTTAKRQAEQAEGALYASAVNMALEMAYSQIRKETDDARLAELQKSLSEAKADLDALKKRMFEAKRNEESDSKRLDELRMNERAKNEVYTSTSEIVTALRAEAEKAEKRAAKELALRNAQRIANDESSVAMRKKMDEDVMDAHKAHEAKLSRVILKAAEDYELQVRDFADFETSQQHKIARLEEENKTLQKKIDACTKDSVAVMSSITAAAVERSRRLNAIEDSWKAKYEAMRTDYQTRIQTAEEAMAAEDKVQMRAVDELTRKKRQEHLDATSDLESRILKAESGWKQKVDAAFNTHGDKIDDTIRALEEESHRKAIRTRRDCEEKIRALYEKLDRVKYIEGRHDTALEQLRRVLQTMGAMHDRLMADAPHDASREMKALKAKLHRFEEQMVSSPVRVRPHRSGGGGGGVDGGGQQTVVGADGLPIADDIGGSRAASAGREGSYGYGYPMAPVKIFNVFSREQFDAINARRFGPTGQPATASANAAGSHHHQLRASSAGASHRPAGLNSTAASALSTRRSNASGMGVLNGSGISLIGGPHSTAGAAQPSLRPSLLPSSADPAATPLRPAVRTVDPNAAAAPSPVAAAPIRSSIGVAPLLHSNQHSPLSAATPTSAAALSSANNAHATPRRIHLPENVPTPRGSLHMRAMQQGQGQGQGVFRSAAVRRL